MQKRVWLLPVIYISNCTVALSERWQKISNVWLRVKKIKTAIPWTTGMVHKATFCQQERGSAYVITNSEMQFLEMELLTISDIKL